ncbi:MAG: type I restriction endonuclease subunit R [Chitinophagaceae bacterium]|nr:MAG: type I restriction endonuclease subunit R [Chitinophagaceae bacterium]
MSRFNEDSRVKLPALLHLARLGYTYIPRKEHDKRLEETNIFPEIFSQSLTRINPDAHPAEIERLLQEIVLKLDYDDLGRDFYKLLTASSGIRLIDFSDFSNNSFHVTTELTCKKEDDEFRPDITILVNGMPLAFIEVKKPNNREGILAERKRINERFRNKKFRRFANITQLMIFSNNMKYEDGVIEPLQGAYYATSAYSDLQFNYFREEDAPNPALLKPEDDGVENIVLKDNNLIAIKHAPDFITNKRYDTPTNAILTSLLSRERLAFILRYAIAFVDEEIGGKQHTQKHIMRYPQLFATKAIEKKLLEGLRQGIIWHTQGSGKTALAFYNVKFLTDHFQKQNVVAKFYFIVDRIDLANQSAAEFAARGLVVNRVNSRADFLRDIQKISTVHNSSGDREISVVNIQKFTEESVALSDLGYAINIQRVFFLDEAHRSYNPKGNYLANLINSDKSAIKIALTGTPLLREVAKEYDSKALFGDYIHKYYYNQSIADGYTLRLIREGIDTTYKMQMEEVLEQIKVVHGDIPKSKVFAHRKFVRPMLDCILNDLESFRLTEGDKTVGAMVVCDTSDQAKELFAYFEELHGAQDEEGLLLAAEEAAPYGQMVATNLKASLILHDVSSKDERKTHVKAFKAGDTDILFVYNMLLTGFDAKRLKKLYLARVVKDHNLLQTLTRVNRPYKKFRYGYVVDFADITKAFRETNDNYFRELQSELGDEMANYSHLFKSPEEIQQEIEDIKETLFRFDTVNGEAFQQQVEQIRDKAALAVLVKALEQAKELKNRIRLQGHEELLAHLDFSKMNQLLKMAQAQLDKLNLVDSLNNEADTTNLLNTALEDVIFLFTKVSEEELILADQLRGQLKRTREALLNNFDPKDPEFVSLRAELERIFKKKNLDEVDQADMRDNILLLQSIYDRVTELNRKNNLFKAKYEQDEKYARIHKRLLENKKITARETQIHSALMEVKHQTDDYLQNNANVLANEAYFTDRYLLNLVANEFARKQKLAPDADTIKSINTLIAGEYIGQYNNYLR